MRKLFDTIGITIDECSPFYQSFSSPEDLGHELIRYLPHSFTYDNSTGNGVEDTAKEDATAMGDPEDTNIPS